MKPAMTLLPKLSFQGIWARTAAASICICEAYGQDADLAQPRANQPYFHQFAFFPENSHSPSVAWDSHCLASNNPHSRHDMTFSNPNDQTRDGASADTIADGRPGSGVLRFAAIGVVLLGLVMGAALALELFVVERIPDLTVEKLDAARALWDAKGPGSYVADYLIEGAQPGMVHVEVRDGEVIKMTRDGIEPRQPRTWVYWSIPGRFDEIEREFDIEADPEHEMSAAANTRVQLRAEFDPNLGYPTRFHRVVFGGGTEVYWRVTNFQHK
jgi:hypothetical protein